MQKAQKAWMSGAAGAVVLAILGLLWGSGALPGSGAGDPAANDGASGGSGGTQIVPVSTQVTDTISVCTFNIQVFGDTKAAKPEVMRVLADVVRRFDIVAIQEIRTKNQDHIARFLDLVNAEGAEYDAQVGPRLGRTSSKEQYAFLYNTRRIEVDLDYVYTVNDPDDLLHREPFVSRFRVRGPAARDAFTFTLVNIHTDPDETDQELDALDDVFRVVAQDGSEEDDVIILGDLNVDHRHLGQLGQVPNILWTVEGTPTNTRGDKQYDNLVLDRVRTAEYTGRGGVLSLQQEYGLTLDAALEVSDHLPVWAEFRAMETRGPIAALPNGVR